MKKQLLTAALSLFVLLLNAQTIPNAGFEIWLNGPSNQYMEPQSWATSNQQTGLFPFGEAVKRSLSPFEGNFAAQIGTVTIGTPGALYTGILTNGKFISTAGGDSIGGGSPFNYIPRSLSFEYQYSTPGSAKGRALVYLYKRDTSGKRKAVGFGQLNLQPTSGYTLATVPISYDTLKATQPDSILIIFTSSQDVVRPELGTLLVDNITVGSPVGIDEPGAPAEIRVLYPNPAANEVNVDFPPMPEPMKIYIYDLLGREVLNTDADGKNGNVQINVSPLPNGLYVLKLLDADGRGYSAKLAVAR